VFQRLRRGVLIGDEVNIKFLRASIPVTNGLSGEDTLTLLEVWLDNSEYILYHILEMAALRRQVLSSEVFELLRQRIISLEIFPGSRVDIPSLSKELEVSAIPIREAIKRLTERGLVISTPGLSYRAIQINEDTVRDVFALRRLLEGDAVFGVRARLCRKQIARSRERSVELLSGSISTRALRKLFDAEDVELHMKIIVASSPNRMLLEHYKQMSDITTIITHLNNRIEQSLHEHIGILDALLAFDIEEARQQLLAHLNSAEEACLPVPSSGEEWLATYERAYGLEAHLI